MGRGKQLFAYPMDWLFPNLSQPNKTNMAFFVSHLVHKKKKTKKKDCSVKLLFPPSKLSTPLETKRKYHHFNLNYRFHLQWVCGGG